MKLVEIGSFAVAHEALAWPWIAIDPTGQRFAFAVATGQIETRTVADGALSSGPSFTLPTDLGLPTTAPAPTAHDGTEDGLRGFALDAEGTRLAATGRARGASVVVTLEPSGAEKRSRLDALTGAETTAHAIAFDRSGTRIWLSAESATETVIVLIEASTHAVLGIVRSAPLPPPSFHELHVHPQDDAVLLLAACGQHGTFARVAGFADGPPEAVPTALDGGSVPAGFVGFSADCARVHLVEADELRTHAWPGLEELSSVELGDDFVSSYSGAVLGHRVFVDGHDGETGDFDAAMVFDRSGLRGVIAKDPVPKGMWVGRLGVDMIVTVEAQGEPARGLVVQIPELH